MKTLNDFFDLVKQSLNMIPFISIIENFLLFLS